MRVDEFDYELPRGQIAQRPPAVRGSSRLMVVDRAAKTWLDSEFARLIEWLRPGDLVVGSSRVDLQACKLEYSIVSPK